MTRHTRDLTGCPEIMTNPLLLKPGDPWRRRCRKCGMITQGGRAGLEAHLLVVHNQPESDQ